MINIMLVDDHVLVCRAVEKLLADEVGIRVVSTVSSGEDALDKLCQVAPDIAIIDIMMPGMGGIEVIKRLLKYHRHIKVIVLTGHEHAALSHRLLGLGVSGYITKKALPSELIKAIQQVYKNKRYVSQDMAQKLATCLPRNASHLLLDGLSQREYQVLLMLVRGDTIKEIATQLNRSEKTISTFRYRLYEKLGVKRDAELFILAAQHGLLN